MKFPTKFATVLLLQAALIHNALYAYAFVEEFNPPPQGSSAGWQVQSGSAEVVSGVSGANGTALRLNTAGPSQAEASVSRPIPWNSSESIAFIDFLIKPAANSEGSLASILVNGTQVAFQVPASSNQGEIWALHGHDDNGANEAEWLKTPGVYTTDSSHQATAFARVTLRHDYLRKVWDLFINGKMASANLGFEDRAANLTQIEFFGSYVADTHIDQLQADPANMLFADADKDGVPDAWETANGSNPNLYDRDAINPLTGKSFLEGYLGQLWSNATAPNGNGVVTVSSASIPPISILSQHQPVGALKGSMSVGGDGSGSYSIPLDLPKGTGGMEPKLSLNYSSGGGNGLLGVGWSLGGLQKITRGPSSAMKDRVFDKVDFDVHDRFFLDGERLICVSGTYGAAGSEYRTEMDAFSRIKLNGSAPLSLWWSLETKAGLIVELGSTADSLEAVGAGILSWSVNKVLDTSGNYYSVLHTRDTAPPGYTLANLRVSSISYTGRATMQPYSTVNFDYEARNDVGRAYTPHAGYLVSKRLSKIRVSTGNYVNHSYVLTYEESFQSNRSFLKQVQKLANDNPALAIPVTSFNYDGLGPQEPLWSSNSTSRWPVYSSGWDATSNVNSMVTAGNGGASIRLDGDVSRSWNVGPGGITLFPDSVMTFEFQAQSLTSGALIGLDTDSFYQVFPARLFRIGGTGFVPVLTAGTHSYSEVPGAWSTYTLPVGQIATGVHSHLILMNVDDNAADGVASATFRNVKIYRTGSQTPASVAPLNFSTPSELPRFAKANGQDLGVRFMDLNSDGLPELCDWRATNYTLAAGSLIPNTVGQVYRNTGSSFVADPSLCPPTSLPLGYRADDLVAYNYDRMHHLLAGPVDINGDGKVDLLGSTVILYSGGSLSNSLSFHSRINGSWQELVSYRLPFRPKNLASSAPYGGTPRDSHYEWLDLDADGYTDLLYHTTSQGRLVDPINENVVLAGPNTTTAWLNKIHLEQGWVRNDTFALPEPLKVTFPVAGDKGRRLADLDGNGHPEVSEAVSLGYTELRKTYRMNHLADGTATGWTSIPGAENPPAELTLDLPAVPGNTNANAAFVNASAEPLGTQLTDLNGDGLPDIVKSMLSGNVVFRGIYLNRGGSQASRWGLEPVASNAGAQRLSYDLPGPLNMYLNNQLSLLGYEMPDLNGDGLIDVLLSQNVGSELYNRAYLNSGSGWIDRPAWGLPAGLRIYTNSTDATNGWRRAMLQDVNGDGFPDLITGLIGESPKIWMNNCRKEVLTSVTDGFGSTLQVEYRRLNDPTPVPGATESTYQAGPSTMQTGHAAVMDSRLVVARLTEPDGRGGNRSTRRHYGDLRFDRVHEASLGFGWMEVYEEMQPAGQSRTVRGYSHTDTCRDYPNAGSPALTRSYVQVPATSPVLPGVSTGYKLVSEETSTYGELYYYEGVGGIIRRPVQTGSVSKKWDLNGTLMGQTTTSQTFETPVIVPHTWVWNGTTMVPSPTDSFSLKSLAERNGLALPIYGFVANSTITALDGSSTVTTNNYSHTTSGGKWHLGRLSSSTVTKTQPGAASVTKSAAFTYSADTGLIATETVQPSNTLSVTTTYERDVFGNVTSKTVAGSGQSRSSQTTYDARGRFPISETNELGTVSTSYDDDRALVESTTDLDGHVTTYEYDAFGTKVRTNLPDGTASAEITRYATNADLPAAVAAVIDPSVVIKWAKYAQASGTPVAKVWYDALGREIAASSLTLTSYNGNSGTWTEVYSVNFYDWKGRKEKTSEPFSAGETVRWTKLVYDPLDRVIATEHPDGTIDKVVTIQAQANGGADPLLYTRIQNRSGGSEAWDVQYLERWENQHGRLIHSKDESGQDTWFTHDVEGRVKTVTVGGVLVLTNTWDLFGNKTGVTDADAGSSSSTYNAFGEILTSTNALGQVTSTTYDSLGRVASVTKPEGTWTTAYRTSSPAKGEPASVSGPGQSDSFTYDAFGRVTSTTSVCGGETFVTRSTYDALGRVSTATDAGGLTIVNDYDGAYSTKVRVRTSIQGKSETLWQARTFDSSGRPTQQITAHGVVVNQTFQPTSGKLLGIQSVRGTTTLQNLSYTWDAKTNLKSRTDSLAGTSETFAYDKLNRLVSTTDAASSVSNYTYAPNGNLLSKPFLSGVSYGGTRPHAITAATVRGVARSYTYDAAGRVTSDGERTYQWSSFGQLKEVSQFSTPLLKTFDATALYTNQGLPGIPTAQQYQASIGTATFEFDASGSRRKQDLLRTYAGGGTARLTTLYLGSYERETLVTQATTGATSVLQKTLHRHQLGTAIYTVEEKPSVAPVVKLSALLTDHLGSTDVILAATWNGTQWSGFQAERQSFDPWGERRNADTWTTQRTQGTDPRVTSGADYHRGFTGHEMLDDFGLIHMNGRIYDPDIGRFLSCDPYVQVPEWSQNFNRYTYVLNNPLSLTDSSGFFIDWIIAACYAVYTAIANAVVAYVGFVAAGYAAYGVVGAIGYGIAGLFAPGLFLGAPTIGAYAQLGLSIYNAANTLQEGGNWGDVLRGVGVNFVSAAISTGVLHGMEPVSGKAAFATSEATVNTFKHVAGHAILGGASSAAMGGRFQDGLLSAAASTFAMDAGLQGMIDPGGEVGSQIGVLGRTAVASIIGGTASAIGGGKFANGAFTSAWQHLANAESEGAFQRMTERNRWSPERRARELNGILGMKLDDIYRMIDGLKYGMYVNDNNYDMYRKGVIGPAEYERIQSNNYQTLEVAILATGIKDPNYKHPPAGTVTITGTFANPGGRAIQGGLVFSYGQYLDARIFGGAGLSTPGKALSIMVTPNSESPNPWQWTTCYSGGYYLGVSREAGSTSYGITTPGASVMKNFYVPLGSSRK